jgi:hypothetical protein
MNIALGALHDLKVKGSVMQRTTRISCVPLAGAMCIVFAMQQSESTSTADSHALGSRGVFRAVILALDGCLAGKVIVHTMRTLAKGGCIMQSFLRYRC